MSYSSPSIFVLTAPFNDSRQGPDQHSLFVCSYGVARAPTAAKIALRMGGHNSRSCGSLIDYALIPISLNLIYWADKIYFVNSLNYEHALDMFPLATGLIKQKSEIWDIPDVYTYDQPELVNIITPLLQK